MESDIPQLLATLQAEFDLRRGSMAERRRVDPDLFTSFAYIRPDENRISRIVRDLLDPAGVHGQGIVFLELFLKAFGTGAMMASGDVRVEVERRTLRLETNRRIDVVVRGSGWALGIENKPWAVDQQLQISDYLTQLAATPVHRLLYLTREGTRPSTGSISEAECSAAIGARRLRLTSYIEISDWLSACIDHCAAERVRWFLLDFRSFVDRQLIGKLPQAEEFMVVETVVNAGRDQLATALELLNAKEAIRDKLIAKLMADIARLMPPEWSIHSHLARGQMLGIRTSSDAPWIFGLHSDHGATGPWWYGIMPLADRVSDRERFGRFLDVVRQHIEPGGRPTAPWPFWRWFEGGDESEPVAYANWDENIRPWLDMHDGTMAQRIIELASRFAVLYADSKP